LGIRIALGASTRRAIASAALPGASMASLGVMLGLIAARGVAQLLQRLVWGVSVTDPTTFVLSAAVVLLVALIAAVVPALRIARMNPVRALRTA
jgi:ABC-type antimicrobial peptide transport system permease subunit